MSSRSLAAALWTAHNGARATDRHEVAGAHRTALTASYGGANGHGRIAADAAVLAWRISGSDFRN